MERVFNEWMKRYTERPEDFGREWQSVTEFLKQSENGEEPSYGKQCAEYFKRLSAEINSRPPAPPAKAYPG